MQKSDCKTFVSSCNQKQFEYVEKLRELIELAVQMDAPEQELDNACEDIVKITDRLKQYGDKKSLPQFTNPFPAKDPTAFLPYSPVSGRFNPIAPPLEFEPQADKLVGRVTLGHAYEGPPKSVHGAVIAGIYDQLMAMANMLNGTPGPTAYLNVSYKQPTPIHTELLFEAKVSQQEGKKITVHACCRAGDTLLTECEALFIKYQ